MKTEYFERVKALILSGVMFAVLSIGGCSASQEVPGTNGEAPAQEEAETPPEEKGTADEEKPKPEEEEPEEPQIVEEEVPATVTILGTEYDRETEQLDLSECTQEDVPEVADAIRDMPKLAEIGFMNAEDVSLLSLEDIAILREAAPDAVFYYSFDLYDQRLSLADTVVRFKNTEIGNEGEEDIRRALSLMNRCTYFVLDDCGIDDEIMAGIREDYPDTKVVWRVHVGNKSALTDDTVIRMTHGIDDSMTGPLQYCTDVVYMDLGHDSGISDISFISNMHDLECLVLSSSSISDLSPLKECPALTWLELVYCGRLSDISPIAGMDSIKYLNISFTGIRDISSIADMEFDRFSCIGNRIPQETIDEYKEAHPDCMAVFTGNPWGYAWRYDDYGYTFFSYYARMREVFRYEERSPGGFKFPEYEEPENENAENVSDTDTQEDKAEEELPEEPADIETQEETSVEESPETTAEIGTDGPAVEEDIQ